MGFGGSKTPSYTVTETPEADPVPTAVTEKEPTVAAVRDEEIKDLQRKRGYAGTILTSPLGVYGSSGNVLGL